MKRIIALSLPLFATDRLTRPGKRLDALRKRPLATVARAGGRAAVAAANAAARAAGVVPGVAAADASALCPGLATVPAEPDSDREALESLAEWCRRWSPWTAPDRESGNDHGLWIDASGCAHLFGGEKAMLDDVVAALEGLGFAVRAAIADTPGAAWAAARFGDGKAMVVPEGAARQLLAGLPVAALRLPPETVATLRRLGVRRLDDLMALPRAPLAARFGAVVARRIDQLLGRIPEPLSALPPQEPLFARLAFAEPIGRTEDVAAAVLRLLNVLAKRLERRGLGARSLILRLFRVDGGVLTRHVGTAAPVRTPGHLARLFAEGLDGLDAGFGIEAMTMTAAAADPLGARQTDMERRPEGAALPLLMDRLARRLGPAAAWRPLPRPTHLPERLCAKAAPTAEPGGAWPRRLRPVRLLPRPEPIRVAEVDGRPARLYRHGETLAVARAEGPERIAAEWWHAALPPPAASWRDYWRVEDERGRRWWLFRDGGDGRWYLHGGFG
ncbi:MAG: DNA polymerase Y family protein [Magnetospirillum sp.]|nr:DNA polymerase Y family protein [Magnetospirillum sp.]